MSLLSLQISGLTARFEHFDADKAAPLFHQDQPGTARVEGRPYPALRMRDGVRWLYDRDNRPEGKKTLAPKGPRTLLTDGPELTGALFFIVEGEGDAVALLSVGVEHVVAVGGTQAKRHAPQFKGKRLYLVFDGDAAGRKGELAEALAERRAIGSQGRDIADEYVTSVLVGMQHQGDYRFVLRDSLQFRADAKEIDAALAEDYRTLRRLVLRLAEEGFFRRDLPVDLEDLTRSLFIVARYWSDHLQDHEGRHEITWPDQVRGLHHHLIVLRPWLTSPGRRSIEDAARQAIQRLAPASPP